MIRFRAVVPIAVLLVAACGGGAANTSAPVTGAPTSPATPAPSTSGPASLPTLTPTTRPDLLVVAVGDSIAYNLPDDCPGCTAFVDLYGDALATATGKTVGVLNMSQHNGLTVRPMLSGLQHEQNRIGALANADAIIVGIAHNDAPLGRAVESCGVAESETPDWSKYTDTCIAADIERFRPEYEAVYKLIADLRTGKPTILRTINRYNDWNGWPGHELSAEGVDATVRVIKAWNKMICAAAKDNGFVCADISTAFNGKDGRKQSGDLVGSDYTHPSQKGNDAIAGVLIGLGFAPLAP